MESKTLPHAKFIEGRKITLWSAIIETTTRDLSSRRGAVKLKLFVLTLKGATMTSFRGLKDHSINFWKELRDEFSSH